jgi:hypothetical protein
MKTLDRQKLDVVNQTRSNIFGWRGHLGRLLSGARAEYPGWGRCGTKPGSMLRTEIPIRTGTWDLTRLGYLEADSVAHCGSSLAGDFIWSLTYTDIFSGWTEEGFFA